MFGTPLTLPRLYLFPSSPTLSSHSSIMWSMHTLLLFHFFRLHAINISNFPWEGGNFCPQGAQSVRVYACVNACATGALMCICEGPLLSLGVRFATFRMLYRKCCHIEYTHFYSFRFSISLLFTCHNLQLQSLDYAQSICIICENKILLLALLLCIQSLQPPKRAPHRTNFWWFFRDFSRRVNQKTYCAVRRSKLFWAQKIHTASVFPAAMRMSENLYVCSQRVRCSLFRVPFLSF